MTGRVSSMIVRRLRDSGEALYSLRYRDADGRKVTRSFASLEEAERARDEAVPPERIERADAIAASCASRESIRRTERHTELPRLVRRDRAEPPADEERPTTRADCVDGPRPCPWYGCRYHLGLDVDARGTIRYVPVERLSGLRYSCALDAADTGPATLIDVGALYGVSRERIRQEEERAISRLPRVARELGMQLPDPERLSAWDEIDAMERYG